MKNGKDQKFEHIISRMQADRSMDAPADVMQYARNLFRTRAAEPKLSPIRRLLATLSVDLAPNRAAFGERSASGQAARQMLFESGDNAVDLRVTASETAFDIRGQILGSGFEKGKISLSNKSFEAKAVIDEIGGFQIRSVPVGEYTLVVTGTDAEIEINSLILN
jgi:hypothetical protein